MQPFFNRCYGMVVLNLSPHTIEPLNIESLFYEAILSYINFTNIYSRWQTQWPIALNAWRVRFCKNPTFLIKQVSQK